jgi:hypothetical protein
VSGSPDRRVYGCLCVRNTNLRRITATAEQCLRRQGLSQTRRPRDNPANGRHGPCHPLNRRPPTPPIRGQSRSNFCSLRKGTTHKQMRTIATHAIASNTRQRSPGRRLRNLRMRVMPHPERSQLNSSLSQQCLVACTHRKRLNSYGCMALTVIPLRLAAFRGPMTVPSGTAGRYTRAGASSAVRRERPCPVRHRSLDGSRSVARCRRKKSSMRSAASTACVWSHPRISWPSPA